MSINTKKTLLKERKKMTIKKNLEIVKTDSRKIKEINGEFAEVEISAGDYTDILKRVPLTLKAAEQKFGLEDSRNSVYGLAISQYFTDQANSLRTDGVARENRERRKTLETVQKLSKEEILASLTDEQKKALGL